MQSCYTGKILPTTTTVAVCEQAVALFRAGIFFNQAISLPHVLIIDARKIWHFKYAKKDAVATMDESEVRGPLYK